MPATEKVETEEVVMTRVQLNEYLEEQRATGEKIILEAFNLPVDDDADEEDWRSRDREDGDLTTTERDETRNDIRFLEKTNSHIRRSLKLYQDYVFGREFKATIESRDPEKATSDAFLDAKRDVEFAFREFLLFNQKRWTLTEMGKRFWRDGEVFSKKGETNGTVWPPKLGFIDPEEIGDENGKDEDKGIVTEENDATEVKAYRRIDTEDGTTVELIPEDEMFFFKDNVDTTEKRGLTRYFSAIDVAKNYNGLLKNEILHRKLQSSLVLVRKVKGSPTKTQSHMDNQRTGTTKYPEGTRNREKYRGGTILTVNESVDISFEQPDSNFSDASPLFKLMVESIGAATGWPRVMLSVDSSDASFASSLVEDSPVNVMVEGEQDDFSDKLNPVFTWVLETAIQTEQIEGEKDTEAFFEKYELIFVFPPFASKDELKKAQAINLATMGGWMSKAEGSRQQQLDPEKMKEEMESESESLMGMPGFAASNTPGVSSTDNNTGMNQGDGDNPRGDDSVETSRRDRL